MRVMKPSTMVGGSVNVPTAWTASEYGVQVRARSQGLPHRRALQTVATLPLMNEGKTVKASGARACKKDLTASGSSAISTVTFTLLTGRMVRDLQQRVIIVSSIRTE